MTEPVKPPDEGVVTETSDRRAFTLARWLFLLLLLFVCAPLCVFNLWQYGQSRRYLTEASLHDVANVAALGASRVTLDVQRTEDLLASALSADTTLPALARDANRDDEGALRRMHDDLLALQAKMRALVSVEELQIVSPAGTLVASTLVEPAPDSEAFATACARAVARGLTISSFSRDRHDPTLLIERAITDGSSDRLATVCGRLRLTDVDRQLASGFPNEGAHASLYLLDHQGNVLRGSFQDGHGTEDARPPLGSRAVLTSGHPWQRDYVSDSGAEVIAAYQPVPTLGWGVLVTVPAATVLAPLHRLEREAAVTATALVLILAGASIFGWRTIVKPIRSLSRTAERVASGAIGETVAPRGPRETVELARTFNRMSQALWESQHVLEERIEERTRRLQESEEFAKLLLDSIDHRVIAVDREYRVIKANAAALRTYGEGLVGTPCYRAFEQRSTPCENCAAARTFATGRPASEERVEQAGGSREAVVVETYPVVGTDGQVESVIEIARTVSAEKQLQMETVHQQRMAAFGLLAAGIAHDIGNPLAAIQSQLQVARQQPDRQEQTLSVVSEEIERMSRMLRELIDFTRRRRDSVMLVSVNQVVEDAARLLSHDPRARTVTVVRHLGSGLPGVRTTEDHLFQVLFNLGLNALDAMSGRGTLEFETSSRSGWVLVRVRDTGHGVPADCRDRLFEPFFTTKASGRGTGLGLFVSRNLVEDMGGDLRLEHTDDRGTVFVIFLPVEEAPERETVT
jgi:C4-dicarboxylate-specific signal transduction histidine kinase